MATEHVNTQKKGDPAATRTAPTIKNGATHSMTATNASAPESDQPTETPDYNSWTSEQLIAELAERFTRLGLPRDQWKSFIRDLMAEAREIVAEEDAAAEAKS